MYQVYYRKYRPQRFDQLVGQEHIVRTLKNAVIQNKLAHAYLFCGPRGTGKTSLARLFAKSINCTNVHDGVSCNECENCLLLQEQDHPDIIEIDAASNNGVDEIRTLVERVKYAPLKGKYKVYIIDEVHMMTSGAFNALLKTLEEPPAHVIFILATTESNKILPTIISRCQRYDFYKVNVLESSRRMQEILELENVKYEKAAINLIANLSDGGLRDALGLLEQVVLYSASNVDVKSVNEVCGMVSDEDKASLLLTLLIADVNALLDNCRLIQSKSLAIGLLFSDLLSILKDALVYKQLQDDSYASHQMEYVTLIATRFSLDQIVKIMDELLLAQSHSGLSSDLSLYFELTLMKLQQLLADTDTVCVQNKSTLEHQETAIDITDKSSQEPVQNVYDYLHPEDEQFEQLQGAITYDSTIVEVVQPLETRPHIVVQDDQTTIIVHEEHVEKEDSLDETPESMANELFHDTVSTSDNVIKESQYNTQPSMTEDNNATSLVEQSMETSSIENQYHPTSAFEVYDTKVSEHLETLGDSATTFKTHGSENIQTENEPVNVMSLEQIQTFVGPDVIEQMNVQEHNELQVDQNSDIKDIGITNNYNEQTNTLEREIVAPGQMSLLEPATQVVSAMDFLEEYIASTDEVLNVLVQANRDSLQSVKQKWENTGLYMSHQSLSRIATILCDAVPVAACENAIVITFDSQTQANFVNSPKQITIIEQFLHEILGTETVCFALTQDSWIDCKNEYMKLRQVGKLPKATVIQSRQPSSEVVESNRGLDYVKQHFDHNIIEEEN